MKGLIVVIVGLFWSITLYADRIDELGAKSKLEQCQLSASFQTRGARLRWNNFPLAFRYPTQVEVMALIERAEHGNPPRDAIYLQPADDGQPYTEQEKRFWEDGVSEGWRAMDAQIAAGHPATEPDWADRVLPGLVDACMQDNKI